MLEEAEHVISKGKYRDRSHLDREEGRVSTKQPVLKIGDRGVIQPLSVTGLPIGGASTVLHGSTERESGSRESLNRGPRVCSIQVACRF